MATLGYVFDAYGTLLDVHSAVRKHADKVGPKSAEVSNMWRSKQLEYTWVRSLMGSYTDFWHITEQALDYALAVHDVAPDDVRTPLLGAYFTLEPYNDAGEALARLRRKEKRIAILSNGSPEMLDAALASANIASAVDDVFSVHAIKKFKTAPDVYRMVTDAWQCKAKQIKFVSSNRWDVAGAQKFGFRPIWLNRSDAPDEYAKYAPEKIIASLDEI